MSLADLNKRIADLEYEADAFEFWPARLATLIYRLRNQRDRMAKK